MGIRVCAAVDCGVTTFNPMFCDSHKTVYSRLVFSLKPYRPEYERAGDLWPKDDLPKVKAVVTRVTTGPIPFYRAEHPDYWDGIGATPGDSLRAMRRCRF